MLGIRVVAEMLESAWLFVGTVAVLSTGAAVLAPVLSPSDGDVLAIVLGVAGFVSWGVWTYGTLNIVVVGESVTYSFAQPSLTLLGVMLALVPGYVALTGPVEVVSRARDGDMRDV